MDKSGASEFNDEGAGDDEVNDLLQQLSEDWSKEGDL